ncbi:MAG: hypothetical protein M3537_00550, partial [Chloroflexota bacterium]|nr:hypothetical protein [Chloroflexota bacterium]
MITAADNPPSLQSAGVPGTLPIGMRGFDDPQADPDGTLTVPIRTVQILLQRGDLYDLPPQYTFGDLVNGNPPWGSQLGDADADGVTDAAFLSDRHNQGMYSAILNNGNGVNLQNQQVPGDSFGEPSCPVDATRWVGPTVVRPCDPYLEDCGGYAHYTASAPTGFTPYPAAPPPSPADWPVVPFPREWIGSDQANVDVIKRLLRFTTSIVSYNSAASAASAYRLEESAVNVVTTAPKTPVAGALLDAYKYLTRSVFPDALANNDPAINCRNYIIVYITDGIDECAADSCTGGTITGLGPSGDLGQVALPDRPAGSRAAANAFDNSVRITGVPVFMVAMMDPSDPRFPDLQCIADNSGGEVFSATDRDDLRDRLRSILDLKRTANFFAAPAIPAFASGFGDSAQIGAVIPSHENENGDLSPWSIWSGSLKSFKLSPQGLIPAVTAAAPTATVSPTPGGPTATPIVSTPTPAPVLNYPDETDPDNADPSLRKPIWNAARVLGYTDPVADLAESAASLPANPAARAPAVRVWPGRKMIFGRSASGVPLLRSDFMPNTAGCTGAGTAGLCFDDLMLNMGLTLTADPAEQAKAILTVQFLRGGITSYGSRDEVLNDSTIRPVTVPTIGPGAGQEQKYSYFYQDDVPAPGSTPQVRTDDDGNPPAGYAHKLGDIFHSEPLMLEPPRYFQYISSNLAPRTSTTTFGEPYIDFANRQGKRRKVVFV